MGRALPAKLLAAEVRVHDEADQRPLRRADRCCQDSFADLSHRDVDLRTEGLGSVIREMVTPKQELAA